MIVRNYPVDPFTQKSFDIRDRITVKDYITKVTDIFRLYQFRQFFEKCVRNYQKKYKETTLKRDSEIRNSVEKPKTLEEFPTSNSDSSEAAGDGGLTDASVNIGHGALLYLQTMKTLAIMFGILSLINLPVYLICARNTENNNLNEIGNLFVYWSVGNLGRPDFFCDNSEIGGDELDLSAGSESKAIELKCDGSNFITTIDYFGFLYAFNKQTLDKTSATETCQNINFPNRRVQKKNKNKSSMEAILEKPFIEWKDFNQTQYNIDSECNLNNMWAEQPETPEEQAKMDEKLKGSIFELEDLEVLEKEDRHYFNSFLRYFADNCINQKNCTINTKGFQHVINEKCKERM